MPSSTAWISCSRETCFSAFNWRRAPTKSRLTGPPPTRCSVFAMGRQKRDVGVTHVTERPFSSAEVYILGPQRSLSSVGDRRRHGPGPAIQAAPCQIFMDGLLSHVGGRPKREIGLVGRRCWPLATNPSDFGGKLEA